MTGHNFNFKRIFLIPEPRMALHGYTCHWNVIFWKRFSCIVIVRWPFLMITVTDE